MSILEYFYTQVQYFEVRLTSVIALERSSSNLRYCYIQHCLSPFHLFIVSVYQLNRLIESGSFAIELIVVFSLDVPSRPSLSPSNSPGASGSHVKMFHTERGKKDFLQR